MADYAEKQRDSQGDPIESSQETETDPSSRCFGSCPQMMTPEQRRAKLADIAERLGVKDALDASSEIRQPHQELFNEPDYLEFQRQRALEADAG